jgi:hypothetical protein
MRQFIQTFLTFLFPYDAATHVPQWNYVVTRSRSIERISSDRVHKLLH